MKLNMDAEGGNFDLNQSGTRYMPTQGRLEKKEEEEKEEKGKSKKWGA